MRQKALLISSGSPEPYYQNIMESTIGIIFMGTPHAGADLAAWASILTNLTKIAKHANQDIVEVLKPGSQILAGLQQEFHRLLERRKQDGKPQLKIFCIYEELPVTGIGMVSHDPNVPFNGFKPNC
jgi:protein SERAC1